MDYYGIETLPEYLCHKKVKAAKIFRTEPGKLHLAGPDGEFVGVYQVDHEWMRRNPDTVAGGYFVVYENGYTAFSPAEPFEKGYTLIGNQTFSDKISDKHNGTLDDISEIVRKTVAGLDNAVEESLRMRCLMQATQPGFTADQVIAGAEKFYAYVKGDKANE